MSYSDNVAGTESGGDPNAQNPNSSAGGLGQFIDSTWLSTLKAHRPDLAQGQSDDALLALKTDPALSKQMVDAYAGDNQAILAKNGLPVTPGTTYLAHFAGPGGAVKILQADPTASAGDILGPAAVKANPFLQGMSAAGLQAWAAKKMGTPAPVPGPQPQAPPPNGPFLAPAQPQAPPIFAPQPAAPQSPSAIAPNPLATIGGALGALGQMPQAPQMPPVAAPAPIFAAAPKPIDLSGLRAALANQQRPPIFARQG